MKTDKKFDRRTSVSRGRCDSANNKYSNSILSQQRLLSIPLLNEFYFDFEKQFSNLIPRLKDKSRNKIDHMFLFSNRHIGNA